MSEKCSPTAVQTLRRQLCAHSLDAAHSVAVHCGSVRTDAACVYAVYVVIPPLTASAISLFQIHKTHTHIHIPHISKGEEVTKLLIGNKDDDQSHKVIDPEAAREFAKDHEMLFMEVRPPPSKRPRTTPKSQRVAFERQSLQSSVRSLSRRRH